MAGVNGQGIVMESSRGIVPGKLSGVELSAGGNVWRRNCAVGEYLGHVQRGKSRRKEWISMQDCTSSCPTCVAATICDILVNTQTCKHRD